MWWLVFQLLLLTTIPLAAGMARNRNRSAKAWAWTAVPLAPLVLILLGDAKHSTPAV